MRHDRIAGTDGGYAEAAPRLLRARLSFAEVHEPVLHLIPKGRAHILDIGSGPGHDAATLAEMGHSVVATEPTPELLAGAIELYGSDKIQWVDDSLPELEAVRLLGRRFDFILMSGVWMHLDEAQRREAMPRIADLLSPGGALALSLRHGPVPPGRHMFEVTAEETLDLAEQSGLTAILHVGRNSVQAVNRAAGVTWSFLGFRSPP